MKKFKKIIALLLSLAMIEGSIYTSNSYFYAARESASSLKINRGIQEALLKSLKASNSDAENENIVTDGDVAYDLATASKAKTENIEDGDILSIASAGNALLSLATASNVDKIVNRSAVSCIKLESVDGTISDPDDFAIGKSGTRNIRLRWIIAPSDIKNMQTPEDVAVEIFIPNGFVPDTTTLETDASWESSYSTISEGTIIILRYVGSSFNDTLNQSIMVVQNAKTLLDNLSTQNTYEFSAKLYNNYENSNKALVVKTEAADKTDGFSFNADNTTPTWDVSTENNDTTWKPRQIIKDWHNSASSDWSTKGSYTTFNYDKKLIVRYEKKDKGYISGDVSFNFPIETLPLYTVNSKQYYQIYASYTDEYGNVLYFNDQAVTESSSYFDVCDGQWVFDAGAIANMADSGDFKTNADGYTYGEILYNKGTFEIQVMPCLYFNRLFYEHDWDALSFESANKTSVVAKNNSGSGYTSFDGEKLKLQIVNGTEDNEEISANAVSINDSNNLAEIAQVNGSNNYNDSVTLSIKITGSSEDIDWKVYDNYSFTIEYKGATGFEEALTPVWLNALKTDSEYGFTVKIYINDAANSNAQRIETILGMKNSSEAYEYTKASNETIVGRGISTWDGKTSLSPTEYVSKIEFVKNKVAGGKLRGNKDGYKAGEVILRAQHLKLDGSGTDIPDGTNVDIVSTIKTADRTWCENTQSVKTVHVKDTLELIKANSGLSLQVNKAAKENGVLGKYVIKKYQDTMVYDENDPPVVVISGNGVTITDRISAEEQRLMYVIAPDGTTIDVRDSAETSASAFIIDATDEYKKSFDEGKEKLKAKWNDEADVQIYAYRARSTAFDTDEKLYNLPALYEKLGIKYAKALVISQDYVNAWKVINKNGSTRVMYLYANQIKPGHLNYEGVVGLDGEDPNAYVDNTYNSELYCKLSDWEKAIDGTYTDSNTGSHGPSSKQEQSISRIVYGKKDTISVNTYSHFVNAKYIPEDKKGTVVSDNIDSSCILAGISVTNISEDRNNIYMDYDDVEYDFAGTDRQLLSITTAVGVYLPIQYSGYQLDIEYTTSDGKTHTYENKLFWNDSSNAAIKLIPLEFSEGTYLTGLKVRTSNEDYVWSTLSFYKDEGAMQPGLPQIVLCRADSSGVLPNKYPYSNNPIGYQHNEEDEREYDELDVVCKLSYKDIFGHQATSQPVTGGSASISKASYTAKYTETVLSDTDTSNNKIKYDGASESANASVNKGRTIKASLSPTILLAEGDVSSPSMKLRPVFYYAIDKDFTVDIAGIEGLEDGAGAAFYPAGEGNGYSGSTEYGYLVIDLGDVADANLPELISKKAINGSSTCEGYIYGEYTIPLVASISAPLNNFKPILEMWTDIPHDSGRDGSSGNSIANIELDDDACTNGAPDIRDYKGNKISATRDNDADGKPEMLYTDLRSADGSTVSVVDRDISGIVPYVTESATGGIGEEYVSARDYTDLDSSKGIFGSLIYVAGNAASDVETFDVYVPVPKMGERNLYKPVREAATLSNASDFGLVLKAIDVSKLDQAGKEYTIYYTQDENPGLNGFLSMKGADWSSQEPSDKASITGIKVSIKALGAGEGLPFEIKYTLDGNKATLGKQTAYQTFYCNYLVNDEAYYGNEGYSHPVVEKYILEDMSITGLVWNETGRLPNSTYELSDDAPYEGAAIKLLKEDGITEIKQTNNSDLSSNDKFKTASDGTYTLYAPCDGNYIVEITKPDGYQLVKKLADTTDISLCSRANQGTAKTDVLGLWPNCAQGRYTLANVNFGIYKMARLSIKPEDIKVHVTDVATASVAKEGYDISLGTDPDISWSITTNSDAIKLEKGSDNTADITGLKAGISGIKASCTDLYGNEVSCTEDVIVFARVLYDTEAKGGSGSVKDSGMYYPSSTPSTAIYKVKDKDGVNPPTGWEFAGWSTDSASTKDNFDRAPKSEWSIGSDVTADIVLYAIYYDNNAYTITYKDGKDGIIWDDENIIINYGQNTPTTSRNIGIYTDENAIQWRFTGWTPSLAATVTGSATYTANWENIGKDKSVYTIIYTKGLHGAFDDDIHGGLRIGSQVPEYSGTKDTDGANAENPKAEAGWIFNGWKPSSRDRVTGDITYTAQWKATDDNTDVYKAVFEPGSQGTFDKQIYELLDGQSVSFEIAPTGKAGYKFVGWDSDGDLVADKKLNDIITISGSNVTWTAIWEQTDPSQTYYTVTYVRGDKGSFITEYYVVKKGDPTPAFIGSLTSVDDAKYYFRGWSTDGASTISTISATVTGDAVYTAAWGQYRSVYYSLSFDGNGSVQDKELSETVLDVARGARIKDGDVTVSPAFPNDPTKEGYTFKGWKIASADDPEGIIVSGNYLKDNDIMPACDVALKADWEKQDEDIRIAASDFSYNIFKDKTKKIKNDDITDAMAIELAKATLISEASPVMGNSKISTMSNSLLALRQTAKALEATRAEAVDGIIVDSTQLDAINSAKNAGVKGEYALTFYTEDYDEALGAGDKATITVTLYEEKSNGGGSSGGGSSDGGTGKHAIIKDEPDNKQPTVEDKPDDENNQDPDGKNYIDTILDRIPKLGWQDFDITWPLLILFIAIIYIVFKHHRKRN